MLFTDNLLLFADFLQLITLLLLLITDFMLVITPFLVVITGPARHFWAPDGGYSGIKRPGLQKMRVIFNEPHALIAIHTLNTTPSIRTGQMVLTKSVISAG